jgi:hypothetical protein
LLCCGCPRRDDRTRNRARYVHFSFVREFAHRNSLDGAKPTWVTVDAIVANSSVGDTPTEPLIKSQPRARRNQ